MADGGLAARVRRALVDVLFAVWAPFIAVLIFLLLRSIISHDQTGMQFHGTLAIGSVVLARSYWREKRPPPAPGWTFTRRHRGACGDLGAALVVGVTAAAIWAVGFPTVAMVIGGAVALAVPVLLWRLVFPRQMVKLTPEGLAVRGRRIAWEDITGVDLRRRLGHRVVVKVRSGRPAALREAYVRANLVYLLDLIGYYVAHPERRAGIGTADESERVIAALLQARMAAPVGAKPVPLPS